MHYDCKIGRTRIDLIGFKDNHFSGFEVEDNFGPFANGHVWNQIKEAKSSGLLDDLFVVIPYGIYCRVRDSYSQTLEDCGVGLMYLKGGEFHEVQKPRKLERTSVPNFSRTEEDFIPSLVEYFEQKGFTFFDRNGILPAPPREFWGVNYVQQPVRKIIDLTFVTKNRTIHDAVDSEEVEHIGVEIKVKASNWKRVEQQLREYRCSASLSRLFLALPSEIYHQFLPKIKESKLEFGVLAMGTGGIEEVKESPRFGMKFDSIGKCERLYGDFFYPQSIYLVGYSDSIHVEDREEFKRMLLLPTHERATPLVVENVEIKLEEGLRLKGVIHSDRRVDALKFWESELKLWPGLNRFSKILST